MYKRVQHVGFLLSLVMLSYWRSRNFIITIKISTGCTQCRTNVEFLLIMIRRLLPSIILKRWTAWPSIAIVQQTLITGIYKSSQNSFHEVKQTCMQPSILSHFCLYIPSRDMLITLHAVIKSHFSYQTGWNNYPTCIHRGKWLVVSVYHHCCLSVCRHKKMAVLQIQTVYPIHSTST